MRKAEVGIREVTAEINDQKDLFFHINKRPFQVLGAGYSSDIFLQWNGNRFKTISQLVLDIGLNTIRLEGKLEHPELYEIADRHGIMVLPGWECCDKWEAWNHTRHTHTSFPWTANDYHIANASMRHEAAMLQTHPSVLGFMIGSDWHPDDKATDIYVDALNSAGWQTPIISSGSKRGYPKCLGPSGMKMAGPYSWVPPSYWWDTEPSSDLERFGAAFGFGSELGAGVGTPEIASLLKFMHWDGVHKMWQQPNATHYHMGTGSTFSHRTIYNSALWARYGFRNGSEEYLMKAQMMDYEATRAQFEAYSAKWNAKRPATGMIYWMLNNAWPSMHWNLFDFYLRPGGSYFGAKIGARIEHIAYDYVHRDLYLINHSLDNAGPRTVHLEIINKNGTPLAIKSRDVYSKPNTSRNILFRVDDLDHIDELVFMRLGLKDDRNLTISNNIYWLPGKDIDALAWSDSDWYYTPVEHYADFTALDRLPEANVAVVATRVLQGSKSPIKIELENHSPVPAVFIRMNLVNFRTYEIPYRWEDVLPVTWEDNYITLWPHERKLVCVYPMSEQLAEFVQLHAKNAVFPEVIDIVSP